MTQSIFDEKQYFDVRMKEAQLRKIVYAQVPFGFTLAHLFTALFSA